MEAMGHGICRLALVPVRAEASDKSEMVTQLLFGEQYSVLEISANKKWVRIRMSYDGYEGWIDALQHKEISNEYYDHLSSTEFKIATDITSTILYKGRLLQILIGSILPISSAELFEMNEKLAFNGSSKNLGDRKGYDFLKEILKNYMNAPYLWGGRTPFGIDCSGFTQQVFKLCGYALKRDSTEQYLQGEKVNDLSQTIPGDLAFFQNDKMVIHHVGIVMEDQSIVHASGFVRLDKLDDKGIFNEEMLSYSHRLAGFRRIFKT